jgi:hypothetical protein
MDQSWEIVRGPVSVGFQVWTAEADSKYVCICDDLQIAEHIIALHNASLKS